MQNSLNDTRHLPVEILSLFLKFCHANGEGTRLVQNGHQKSLPGDRGMFSLSQVCKRWRQIVLSLGALWASEIDVSPYSYLSHLVLERAGSCNLDIRLHRMNFRSSQEELPLWLSSSRHPRIRSIDLRHAAYSGPNILASLLGEEFPLLQTLVLRCRKPTSSELDTHPDEVALDPMVLVKTLGIRHAPALTKVILRNCLLPWDADIYSQLRYLELHVAGTFSKLETEQLPTHIQLCCLISSLFNIEELALGVFPDYDGVVDAGPITLPSSCRRVTLRMTARSQVVHCGRLAASLVLPPDATFIISQICRGDTGHIVERFAGASHPPRALSICTAVDGENKPAVDMITLPFRPGAWLESPAALLTSTPSGHIIFRFGGAGRQTMITALSRIDYSELKLLRITGLRDAHDAKRLLSGDEEYFDGTISFPGNADDAGPVLKQASKLEVLVAPLTNREVLRELESIVETEGNRSPYPLLRTMIQPPLARSDDEE